MTVGYGDVRSAENDILKDGAGHMTKMLNLKLYGGFYKFNCGPYANYAGYVVSKNVQDEKTHTYLVIFPNEKGKQATCIYLWDIGAANQGYDNFLERSIVKCEEMTLDEREEIYHRFTVLRQDAHVWWDDPAKYGIKWRIKS
jgi:hypothetical protein